MRYFIVLLACAVLATATAASANTVASGTWWFKGTLTPDGSGGYNGTIAAIDEATEGVGDGISGFDVFARNGAWATYDLAGGGSQNYTAGIIANHDAYTTGGGWGAFWDPDVADWYNYQLRLAGGAWYVEYNGNVGHDGDLTGASAAPMSGSVDWTTGIATETDTGVYYAGMGTAESPGYAATFAAGKGQSTAGAWDMDWSWGSDYVPLEWGGTFKVGVQDLGGGEFLVSMTPVPEPLTVLGVCLGVTGLGGYIRKRRLA